jgi:hypothetical protein
MKNWNETTYEMLVIHQNKDGTICIGTKYGSNVVFQLVINLIHLLL